MSLSFFTDEAKNAWEYDFRNFLQSQFVILCGHDELRNRTNWESYGNQFFDNELFYLSV